MLRRSRYIYTLLKTAVNEYDRAKKQQSELFQHLIERGMLSENGERLDSPEILAVAQELRECVSALGDISLQTSTLQVQQREIATESHALRRKRDETFNRIKDLDNVRNQRLAQLQRNDRDIYSAIMWLKENQDKFHGQVFDPVCIEVSVRDPRFAKAVENLIAPKDLKVL